MVALAGLAFLVIALTALSNSYVTGNDIVILGLCPGIMRMRNRVSASISSRDVTCNVSTIKPTIFQRNFGVCVSPAARLRMGAEIYVALTR